MIDKFDEFNSAVQSNLDKARGRSPHFWIASVPHKDLVDAYLNGFTDPVVRQEHNCACCKDFLRRVGALVYVDGGKYRSVLWDDAGVPDMYKASVKNLRALVEAGATNVRPYVPTQAHEGVASSGGYSHFFVKHGLRVSRSVGVRAHEVNTGLAVLQATLNEYSPAVLSKVVHLLQTSELYRRDKFLPMARWLRDAYLKTGPSLADYAAAAPAGFCFAKNTALGVLLEKVESGASYAEIERAWNKVLDPMQYQRAQEAPSAGNIAAAEKKIRDLGLEPALRRRYATLADVPQSVRLWSVREAVQATAGVFSHIKPKNSVPEAVGEVTTPATTMTWSKFARTVLPSARRISVQPQADRLVALTTAADTNAPPILSWDREDQRNPVAWAYPAGVDGEVRRRLVREGGRFENCLIRCSLIWNHRDDLDLHCVSPYGAEIYFGNKNVGTGSLDVDMNVRGESLDPVENIRFVGSARSGRYQFIVNNFRNHSGQNSIPFTLELQVGRNIYRVEGVAPAYARRMTMISFDYNEATQTATFYPVGGGVQTPVPVVTGPAVSGWVPVRCVVPTPDTWTAKAPANHVLFLVESEQITAESLQVQGLFPEHLRGDLRDIRSTLEAHFGSQKVDGAPEAAGYGYNDQRPWNLRVRVQTDMGAAEYLIDRMD